MNDGPVTILETRPGAAAVEDLYRSVGWTAYLNDLGGLMAGIEGSSLVFTACVDDRVVGLVRALTDGATVVLIQDLLVAPEFHRQGIGSALVQAVLRRTAGARQTLLLTDDEPSQRAFYESLGFAAANEIKPAPLTAFYLQR